MGWNRLEQHVHRIPKQSPTSQDNYPRDCQGQHRVHPTPVGQRHDTGAKQHADAGQGVAENMEVGSPRAERVAMVQKADRAQVGGQANGRHDGHREHLDVRGVTKPEEGLDDDEHGDAQQQHPVDQGAQNFEADVAVATPRVGRTPGEPKRKQRQQQRGDVGQHVPGVGQQGQRMRQPAANGFQHGDANGERERSKHSPAVMRPVGRDRSRHVYRRCSIDSLSRVVVVRLGRQVGSRPADFAVMDYISTRHEALRGKRGPRQSARPCLDSAKQP